MAVVANMFSVPLGILFGADVRHCPSDIWFDLILATVDSCRVHPEVRPASSNTLLSDSAHLTLYLIQVSDRSLPRQHCGRLARWAPCTVLLRSRLQGRGPAGCGGGRGHEQPGPQQRGPDEQQRI